MLLPGGNQGMMMGQGNGAWGFNGGPGGMMNGGMMNGGMGGGPGNWGMGNQGNFFEPYGGNMGGPGMSGFMNQPASMTGGGMGMG